MSRIPQIEKPFYTIGESAQYLRDQGLSAASESTIDYHYRVTHKLTKPKRAGRKVYWHRDQLDALIEAL